MRARLQRITTRQFILRRHNLPFSANLPIQESTLGRRSGDPLEPRSRDEGTGFAGGAGNETSLETGPEGAEDRNPHSRPTRRTGPNRDYAVQSPRRHRFLRGHDLSIRTWEEYISWPRRDSRGQIPFLATARTITDYRRRPVDEVFRWLWRNARTRSPRRAKPSLSAPRPMIFAETTPTISPSTVSNGPPELPGLIAASN